MHHACVQNFACACTILCAWKENANFPWPGYHFPEFPWLFSDLKFPWLFPDQWQPWYINIHVQENTQNTFWKYYYIPHFLCFCSTYVMVSPYYSLLHVLTLIRSVDGVAERASTNLKHCSLVSHLSTSTITSLQPFEVCCTKKCY